MRVVKFQLAPAHRPDASPGVVSNRIDETEIETPACHLRIPTSVVFKNGGKLETSAGPGDGITAKRDRAKILGGVSQSCHGRSGRDT